MLLLLLYFPSFSGLNYTYNILAIGILEKDYLTSSFFFLPKRKGFLGAESIQWKLKNKNFKNLHYIQLSSLSLFVLLLGWLIQTEFHRFQDGQLADSGRIRTIMVIYIYTLMLYINTGQSYDCVPYPLMTMITSCPLPSGASLQLFFEPGWNQECLLIPKVASMVTWK